MTVMGSTWPFLAYLRVRIRQKKEKKNDLYQGHVKKL